MVETVKYYDPNDFAAWKSQRRSNFTPPGPNFLAAAHYIRKFFDGKGFNWAAVGGLAMLCLGSRRPMIDIHIVYEDQDFQQIRAKLEADKRVKLPKGMNSLFPAKVLLRTGPAFKDAGCTENVDVEVNLLPPGTYGTPPKEILRYNQTVLRLVLNGKHNDFKSLNLLYQIKTLLGFCKSQDLAWDPRQDIVFLCRSYGRQLENIRPELCSTDLHTYFFSTALFSTLTVEDQRRCSMTLVGDTSRLGPNERQPTPPSAMAALSQCQKHHQKLQKRPHHGQILDVPFRSTGIKTHQRIVSAPDILSPSDKALPVLPQTPPLRSQRPTSLSTFEHQDPAIQNIQNASRPTFVHGRATPPPMAASFAVTSPENVMPKLDTTVGGQFFRAGNANRQPRRYSQDIDATVRTHRKKPSVESRFPLQQPDHYPVFGPSDTTNLSRPKTPVHASLRLVGPEGLYSPSTKSSPPPPTMHRRQPSVLSPSTLATIAQSLPPDLYSLENTMQATVFPSKSVSPPPQPSKPLARSNAYREPTSPKSASPKPSPPKSPEQILPPPYPTTRAQQPLEPLIAYITSAIDESLSSISPSTTYTTSSTPQSQTLSPVSPLHSPPHVTDQISTLYRLSYAPSIHGHHTPPSTSSAPPVPPLPIQIPAKPKPKMVITGYEEFAHGPYSAVTERGSLYEWRDNITVTVNGNSVDGDTGEESEWKRQGGFSYSTTPVEVIMEVPNGASAGGGEWLSPVNAKGLKRVEAW